MAFTSKFDHNYVILELARNMGYGFFRANPGPLFNPLFFY